MMATMHSKSPRPDSRIRARHAQSHTHVQSRRHNYTVSTPRSELTHVPHPSFHESQMHMHSLLGSLFRSNSLTHNSSLRTRVLRASPSCAVSTWANQNGAGMPMAVRRVRGRARHSCTLGANTRSPSPRHRAGAQRPLSEVDKGGVESLRRPITPRAARPP